MTARFSEKRLRKIESAAAGDQMFATDTPPPTLAVRLAAEIRRLRAIILEVDVAFPERSGRIPALDVEVRAIRAEISGKPGDK